VILNNLRGFLLHLCECYRSIVRSGLAYLSFVMQSYSIPVNYLANKRHCATLQEHNIHSYIQSDENYRIPPNKQAAKMGLLGGIEMTFSYITHSVFRFIQLVLALTVCGLYGVDLQAADKQHKYSDGKWVYAEITASLSAVTALLYLLPFISRIGLLFIWDTILFILWIALFGLFGNLYIHAHAEGDGGVQRMKNAVWVDLVNALLWLFSAMGMAVFWVRSRGGRSRFTGRADV